MIDQISIFTENKRGAAREIFSALAKESINVLCFVSSDGGEFGTMRLIVSDTLKALGILQSKGYLCKKDNVVAVELKDEPGRLEQFLTKIEEMNINIDYMYVGYSRENSMPIIVFHCEDMECVSKSLRTVNYMVH